MHLSNHLGGSDIRLRTHDRGGGSIALEVVRRLDKRISRSALDAVRRTHRSAEGRDGEAANLLRGVLAVDVAKKNLVRVVDLGENGELREFDSSGSVHFSLREREALE